MDDVRNFGYCENCGEPVTEDFEEYFVDDDGRVFCSFECACETHGLTKVEV
jgi:hypothetical protein